MFPHNLRSLFARAFYNVCHDVVRLADVLGHSSIETTRIYLLSTGKEYARQLDRLGLVQVVGIIIVTNSYLKSSANITILSNVE